MDQDTNKQEVDDPTAQVPTIFSVAEVMIKKEIYKLIIGKTREFNSVQRLQLGNHRKENTGMN
jgi:hypothetical protein